MAYQSLYRKWRPQTFGAMVGQEHVGRTLSNAVRDGRMAHAYLFTGPRGTGKTSAARLLAKALNCSERDGSEPCDHCPSCVSIRDGYSLDVLEIDGASNRGIDEIRDLRERVGMAATTGEYRFYIIDEVHQLTEAAFNALLKTLEEPPAHVVFILATTDLHKVPATISSRCQHFSFHRINAAGLQARLTQVALAEGIDVEPAAMAQLVQVADGSLRDALSILDQAVTYCGPAIVSEQLGAMLGLVPATAITEFAGLLSHRDTASALQLLERLADEGTDLRQLNRQLIDHLRDSLTELAGRPGVHLDGAAVGTVWTVPRLLATIRSFAAIDFSARLSVVPRLPLELAAVEACTAAELSPLAPAAGTAVTSPAQPQVSVPPVARSAPRPATAAVSAAAASPPAPPAPPLNNRRGGASGATAVPPSPIPASADPASADGALGAPVVVDGAAFERGATAAASVPDEQRRRWDRVVIGLRRANPIAQALCNSCQFLGIDNQTVLLSAQGNRFVMDKLNDPKTRGGVERVASEVFGVELHVRCELQAPAEPSPATVRSRPKDLVAEAAGDPTVRAALDAFGARIESVVPLEDERGRS